MEINGVRVGPIEVYVDDKGLEKALKKLKRKMSSEGVPKELKRRRHYMKPSERRKMKQREAEKRRRRKLRRQTTR